MNFKAFLSTGLVMTLFIIQGYSFCGFYVSKADTKLFNKASQVILVREDNRNVITMSNDFYGDVKDFAMVVPVPTVLKEKDIKVVDRYIFDKLDLYSGPRLVEYYDENPCYDYRYSINEESLTSSSKVMDMAPAEKESDADYGVKIEASYTIGEYDILILSAEESGGLKAWLTKNAYKIPKDAEEVLDPYIKSNLKFFVVKVNLDKQQSSGYDYLRPIQISYESNRFMLPIRLGMANAEEAQDLIVYAFTKNGRIETTNYRTTKIPTDKNIPTFINENFGQFYKDAFDKAYKRNGRNTVFLEYSWDLSSSNYTKCDPCSTTPPSYAELKDAGVFWTTPGYNNGWGGADYDGELFMTRLHVKYDREHFPQDLFFQTTPNKENFQGRYIMTHPVQGPIDCDAAANYYKKVLDRRENELDELAYLTGWDMDEYSYYLSTYQSKYERAKKDKERGNKGFLLPSLPDLNGGHDIKNILLSVSSLLLVLLASLYFRNRVLYNL
ncbi:MAG: DUF2330 domain-containing protein [Chitinophagales bacterium]|nr:DUF2330 domain-containing protein [Chitinophagales bacterium]